MNKIKYVLLALALMLSASLVRAEVSGGMFHSVFSTNATVFDGAGTLYAVQLGTPGVSSDYVVLFDTSVQGAPVVGSVTYGGFTTTQTVTPQLIFQSTVASNGSTGFYDYKPYGIRITNGLYIVFGGYNNRAAVYWRRDSP